MSCEKVFNPKLEGKPVVVLSNNDGCIISRSNEAKEIGIGMAEPVFQNKDLIEKHDIKMFSANFSLYGDMSNRVMSILSEFTPDIEIYSIDEAFLSFTDFNPENILKYAQNIKRTVKKWTGIPISIGIGPTKTLAKIANKIAKTYPEFDDVFDITHNPRREELLKNLSVINIWGVGRQYAKFLERRGIKNIWQLMQANDKWIRKNLTVGGLRTVLELRGQSCIDLESVKALSKTILSSRSFSQPIVKLSQLEEAISNYVSIASQKLRSQKLLTSMIGVFIATNRFKKKKSYFNSINIKLTKLTSYTPLLIHHALKGLKRIFKKGYEYKKAGVYFGSLQSEGDRQLSILSDELEEKKHEKLMSIIDAINSKWGRGVVRCASEGLENYVWTNQTMVSCKYTTDWEDLLEVG